MENKRRNMNVAQRILKNTVSLLFSGIISHLFGFIAIVHLARVLGPEDFGKINFTMAIVTYFILISNMGLPLLGAREIAREKNKISEYLGSILTLRLSLAILGFGLLLLMTFLLNKPIEIKYLIILYGLGLIPSALALDWAFQGVEKMEYIALGNILSSGINLGLILYFIKSPEQLLLIPCFGIAGSLFSAGLLFSIFIKDFGRPKFRFDLLLWKRLVGQALPIGLAGIMVQIIWHMDTVMLGFMRSDTEVGYYNAAYKIIFMVIMVIGAYLNSIFPVMSNYYKTSIDSLKKLQSYTVKLMVTVAIPLAIGGTILAKPIINLLYGAKYEGGIIALQILIWALALIFINATYGWGLWSCNKQKEYLKVVTIQAIVNLSLNFVLIPPFGLVGAAIATVAAEFIGIPLYYGEFSKVVYVSFKTYIPKPLFASIIMGLFTFWASNGAGLNIFLIIVGGVFIYSVILYLIGGIAKEEITMVKNTVWQIGGRFDIRG